MLLFYHRTSPLDPTQADPAPGSGPISQAEARSLCGLLLARARRTPGATAYTRFVPACGHWVSHSWSQVRTQVGRWQAALAGEGLSPGERVAVMMANRPEWVYWDLAALGLGLVTVPLYPNDRPESVRHMLEDSGARILLIETWAMAEALAPIAPTLARLQRMLILEPGQGSGSAATEVGDWLPDLAGPPLDLVDDPGRLATIVYTSGTTGAAKGTMLTHRNILWNAAAALERVPARADDRFLSFLPLSHTLERTAGYYLPMMAGSEVVYARSIADLPQDLVERRPSVLIAVPRIFERVRARLAERLDSGPALARRLFDWALALGWESFLKAQGRAPWRWRLLLAPVLDLLVGRKLRARLGGQLRVAVCGGAPLAPEVARTFVALGVPLIQGYGLTEASPIVSVNAMEDNVPESVGAPLPGVQVALGPDDELLVRSPGVMLGYWGQPEASAAAVDRVGWLHTGDQAGVAQGHLYISGRIKDLLVLSTGEKVAPADLEGAIVGDSLFSQVLAVGEGRPFLAALAVPEPGALALLAAQAGVAGEPADGVPPPALEGLLIERMNRRLKDFPAYAKIRRVALVARPWTIEDGSMTPTMKLKRARILARHRSELAGLYAGHR